MKFIVLNERIIDDKIMAIIGDVVYECCKPDYGLSSDDSYITGVLHISVTFDEDGGYPSFTIPLKDLEKIGE